jgi:hypothetical protein
MMGVASTAVGREAGRGLLNPANLIPRSAVDRGSGLQLGLKVQVSGLGSGENTDSS